MLFFLSLCQACCAERANLNARPFFPTQVVYMGGCGDSMVSYVNNHLPEVVGKKAIGGSIHNEAEWLVDIMTDADKQGKAGELATAYRQSQLKVENDEVLRKYTTKKHELSAQQQKELATKRDTVTPAWYVGADDVH